MMTYTGHTPPRRSRQTGFSLIEVSIAIALAAMLSMFYLYNQSTESQLNQAKVQAGYYLVVSDAVGKYMQFYYDALQLVPAGGLCSTVSLSSGDTPVAPVMDCKMPGIANSPVNAFQPTVAELKALGMLNPSFQDSFLWPMGTSVKTSTGSAAAKTFVNRIQAFCPPNANVPLTMGPLTCNAKIQFKSLTFNAQPFDLEQGSIFKLSLNDMLMASINSMGGDGFMSFEFGNGLLYAAGKQMNMANPIQLVQGGQAKAGVAGILALQNTVETRCTVVTP